MLWPHEELSSVSSVANICESSKTFPAIKKSESNKAQQIRDLAEHYFDTEYYQSHNQSNINTMCRVINNLLHFLHNFHNIIQ